MPMTLVPDCLLCLAFVMLAIARRAAASVSPEAEASAPAECSAYRPSVATELPNVMCCSSFAAPNIGARGRIVASGRQLGPPTLLQVSLLSPVGKSGGEQLCGLDATGRSDRTFQNIVWAQASNSTVVLRRGVDRRWLLSSSFIDPEWYTVMAWTNASLRVLFDPSCSGSRNQLFVQEYIPAWSICRRFANGSSIQIEGWNSSTLFAQDRRLAPWVVLPNDYECRDGKDYELIVSAANTSTTLAVTLYTRPGKGSCRMLCIAEQCDESSFSDHLVGGSQSLTIRYQVRSTASQCDLEAYTGFALVLQENASSVLTLTTYELDSPFASNDPTSNNKLIIIVCVVSAVVLVIIVVVSIIVALWRSRRSQRKLVGYLSSEPRGSTASVSESQNMSHIAAPKNYVRRGAYCYAPQNNRIPGAASQTATLQEESQSLHPYADVAEYSRNPPAAAHSTQVLDRSNEIVTSAVGADDVYAEIDDLGLSTAAPNVETASCHKAQGHNKNHFLGSSSLADSKSVLKPVSRLASNTYTTLDGRIDVHAYSVPSNKPTLNLYNTLDGPIGVNNYSVPM